MPRTRHLHRFGRRVASAAVATLLVAVALLARWHESTTLHVRCATHGELMHVSHATVRDGATPKIGAHELAARDDDAVGEHEHCGLIGAVHTCAVASIAPVVITDATALEVVRSVTPIELIARATFRLAPKTSPPV